MSDNPPRHLDAPCASLHLEAVLLPPMPTPTDPGNDGGPDRRWLAALDLVSHVGINHQILYDERQAVYVARAQDQVAGYLGTGLDPVDAVLGLAEKMLEGRPCPNCDRATAIDTINVGVLDELPARESLCWIILDPRTCRYTRDCGADIWT
jgi:hypothetical protein